MRLSVWVRGRAGERLEPCGVLAGADHIRDHVASDSTNEDAQLLGILDTALLRGFDSARQRLLCRLLRGLAVTQRAQGEDLEPSAKPLEFVGPQFPGGARQACLPAWPVRRATRPYVFRADGAAPLCCVLGCGAQTLPNERKLQAKVGPDGFEPSPPVPKTGVLPLDDGP